MSESFLLDSSVFITPHRQYYPFDFAGSFWSQLEGKLKADNVMVLDVVVDELSKMEDELSQWISGLEDFQAQSIKSEPIIHNYGTVLNYIQHSDLYQEEALRNWSKAGIADPWLIAAAMDSGATIITTENTKGTGLSKNNPSRNPKIPDVANHFGIRCESLFYFMRQMEFKL